MVASMNLESMHSQSGASGHETRQTASASPVVRLSKLSKRRRPPREVSSNNNNNGEESLRMALSSGASAMSSSNRSRFHHNDDKYVQVEESFDRNGHCKENMLNGRLGSSVRAANKGGIETADDGDGGGMAAIHTQVTGMTMLGFIHDIDKSILLLIYKSPALFQRYLERSFKSKTEVADSNARMNPDAVHHNILGQIDPPSAVDSPASTRHHREDATDEPPIAFPTFKFSQCRESMLRKDDSRFVLSQRNLINRKRTGHGLCLPSAWYRFPPCSKIKPPSKTMSVNDGGYSSIHCSEQEKLSDAMLSSTGGIPPKCNDEGNQVILNNEQQPTNPPIKYQGKIRIESDRGATVREVFDIEKSNFAIGKLNMGDERYYIEKKILPPPPISLLDDSDKEHGSDYDDDDDECVAVVRYKICLNDADLAESHNGGDNDNPFVGWISDRGRLANDPYLILKEI